MTQRYSVTRWIAASLTLSLVGLVSQSMASTQAPPTETRQGAAPGDPGGGFREISY
jgi:hypothetical protein